MKATNKLALRIKLKKKKKISLITIKIKINYKKIKNQILSLESGLRHFVTQEQVFDVLNCLSELAV